MASFEEAVNHGMARSDMEDEARPFEQRMEALGCHSCKYRHTNYNACEKVVREIILYPKCPYYKKEV